jgi:hypothetical protein
MKEDREEEVGGEATEEMVDEAMVATETPRPKDATPNRSRQEKSHGPQPSPNGNSIICQSRAVVSVHINKAEDYSRAKFSKIPYSRFFWRDTNLAIWGCQGLPLTLAYIILANSDSIIKKYNISFYM